MLQDGCCTSCILYPLESQPLGAMDRPQLLSFHLFILVAWLADEASLMCFIVMMGRLIAQMFSTFSL